MSESETDNRKSMLAQEYQGTNPNVAYYHNYAPPVYNQYTNSQCSTHTAYGHHSVPHSGFGPQTGHQFSTSGPSIDHYENELQTQSLGTSDSNDQLLFVPSSFVVTSPAGQQPIGRSQLVVGGSSGSLGAQADYHQRLHNQQQQHQQHHLHYGYNQPITYQQQQAETYYSDTYYQPNGVAVSASYYQYPNSAEYSIKYKHHNGQQPSQQHLQQQQQQSQLPHRTFPAIGPAPASESQSIGPAATPYGAANAQSAGDRTGDFFGSSAIAIGQSPDGCSHTNLAPLPLPAIKSISCSQSSSSSAGIVSTPSSVIELESSSSSGHHDQDCRRPILTGLHRHQQQQQQHHQQQHQAKHQKQPTPGTSATALPVIFSKDSQAPARSHHARRMHQCGDELASFDVEPARGSTRHMGTGRIVAQFGLAGGGTNKPPATLAGSDTMDAITTRVRQPAPRRPAGHVGGGGGGNVSGGHGTVKKITKDGMVIARRKNATREITAILKCWLELNLGNPYPNKCEKGVLSCASSMTGTQVSTWFANARRRMKKEEKLYEYMSCKPSQRLYRGPKASEVRLASAIANRALNKLAEQVGCGAAAQSTASMEPSAVAANANLMVGLRKFVDQLNKLAEEKRKEEQVGSSSIISSSSSCPTVVATSTSSSSSSSLSTTSSLSSLSSSTSSSSSTTASPTPPPTPKVRGPTDMAMARSQQQHQQQPSSTTTNYNHDPSMVL